MVAQNHIIGDVHGCRAALEALLTALGCHQPCPERDPLRWAAPPGTRIVFVGDLVDRGADSLGSLTIALRLAQQGMGVVVLGNHELRLIELLRCRLAGVVPASLPPSRLQTRLEVQALSDAGAARLAAALQALPAAVSLPLSRGRVLAEEELASAADYLAYITVAAEAMPAGHLPPVLRAAHRALYTRCLERRP